MKNNTKINKLASLVMSIEGTHVSTDFAIIHLAAQAPEQIPDWFINKFKQENPCIWDRNAVLGIPATPESIVAYSCDIYPSTMLKGEIGKLITFKDYSTADAVEIAITRELLEKADDVYRVVEKKFEEYHSKKNQRDIDLYFAWQIYYAEQLIERFTKTEEQP